MQSNLLPCQTGFDLTRTLLPVKTPPFAYYQLLTTVNRLQVENIVYFCFLQTSMMTKYLDAHFLVLGRFLGSEGYWVAACLLTLISLVFALNICSALPEYEILW